MLWYALVLSAAIGGLGWFLDREVRRARVADIDSHLLATAAALDAALRLFPPHELTGQPPPIPKFRPGKDGKFPPNRFEGGERFPGGGFGPGGVGGPPGPGPMGRDRFLGSLGLPPEAPSDTAFMIWRADGATLKALGLPNDLPAPALPVKGPTVSFQGNTRELITPGPQGTAILVSRSATTAQNDLRQFSVRLTAVCAGVLLFGLMGGWIVSRRFLRPIAAIAETAAGISAQNLSERIDESRVESELVGLARVLNATFSRLEEAFARQARFTADASHELRTPLAVLRSQVDLALARPRSAEEYREALQACLRAGERMTELVECLLVLARADAGLPNETRKAVELHRVVSDAIEQVAPLADVTSIRIHSTLDPIVVHGDQGGLSRVVANLLSNAVRYNHLKGEVFVSLARDHDEAVLTVRDTGIGVPNQDRDRLFERFYRADSARSRETGGTGLGLAIAKAIVDAHGGTIGLGENDDGATFWVRLPLA